MAQNVTIAGAAYSSVPAINVPKTGGGTAKFVDTTDADAAAADIAKNKTAYVAGVKVVGTAEGAKPEQSKTLTLGAAAPSTVTPDSGKVLSSVPVVLDTSVIKAENIAKDVTMLGITGTHEGGGIGMVPPHAYESSTITSYAGQEACVLNDAFSCCSMLTTVSFPMASYIATCAFYYCSRLTTVSFPMASYIASSAFYYCSNLRTVNFPMVSVIEGSAFMNCSNLSTTIFPNAKQIHEMAFDACSNLTTVSFPMASIVDAYAFRGNFRLSAVSFSVATRIGSLAFFNCSRLLSLTLLSTSYATLANSNALSSTPIGGNTIYAGGYGSIFVPISMLSSYKTRTNWSYYSSRFVGV